MVDPKVCKVMQPYFEDCYGNASSTHECGVDAHRALLLAREAVAKSIRAKEEELIFTSGGTESNNMALKGLFWKAKDDYKKGKASVLKNHIVTTKVEHACIMNTCEWLETQGAKVTYLDVDSDGFVSATDLKAAIGPKTFVVSVIHGNNEIGTVQDLVGLGGICREAGVLFHTDACQSFTKVPIDVRKLPVDLMTLNSHKIHGPKGVGALWIREGIEIVPLIHGGGHEKGLRGGTENVAGVVGFAEACKRRTKNSVKNMVKLRNYFIDEVLKQIEGTKLNGPMDDDGAKRLCNNMNITFPVNGEMLGGYLNAAGVCTSKGAACSSNGHSVSYVLNAIGCSDKDASNSIRFTISRFTDKKDLDIAIKVLVTSVSKVK